MTLEATQVELPNFEASTDGKKLHRKNGSNDSGNTQNENTK